jgi:hypothetical protein
MADLASKARAGTDKLLAQDENQLYAELGRRLTAMQANPAFSASFAPELPLGLESQGATEDLKAFGQRFFARVNVQAFQMICGKDAPTIEDREKVIDAFGVGKDAVAAAVAALLVSQLGIAPAIASVVAALIIRVFFKPVYDSMCETWKGHQPATTPPGG